MGWVSAALLAALFAGITSILAKCGVRETDSDIATGIRTAVVLVFAWIVVFVTGEQGGIARIAPLSWAFLVASGLATGASWICYFKALSLGDVNKVVPVDKSSTILAALFAIVLFGETSNLAVKLGSIVAIGAGTYLMIERKVGQDGGDAQHGGSGRRGWLWYAIGAAVFAALTSILAKVGIEGVDSNLATAIRTCVVLVMAWGIVAAGRARRASRRGVVPGSIRHRDRRVMAVLLLRVTDRSGEHRRANRQALDRRVDRVCLAVLARAVVVAGGHWTRAHRLRNGIDDSVSVGMEGCERPAVPSQRVAQPGIRDGKVRGRRNNGRDRHDDTGRAAGRSRCGA